MSANKLADQLSRGTLALVLALPLTFTAGVRPCVAAMELGQEKHFDIPPQQLPAALLKFSEQSGVQVTSPGQLIEGRKSPGVVGTFSPGKALAMLLKDTSLNYDIVDGNTVVITGSANSKVSRNDLQKVSDAGNALPRRGRSPAQARAGCVFGRGPEPKVSRA